MKAGDVISFVGTYVPNPPVTANYSCPKCGLRFEQRGDSKFIVFEALRQMFNAHHCGEQRTGDETV